MPHIESLREALIRIVLFGYARSLGFCEKILSMASSNIATDFSNQIDLLKPDSLDPFLFMSFSLDKDFILSELFSLGNNSAFSSMMNCSQQLFSSLLWKNVHGLKLLSGLAWEKTKSALALFSWLLHQGSELLAKYVDS